MGEWVPATAGVDEADASIEHLKVLMSKKYGFAFSLFAMMAKLRRSRNIAIRVVAA